MHHGCGPPLDRLGEDARTPLVREAGEQALAQVYRNCTPPARARLEKQAPIKLYHVDIYMHEGKVDERPPQFIAEIDLPPK